MDRDAKPSVWIFHGDAAAFASGVFTEREKALAWVAANGLSGVISEYRLDAGCFDAAVGEGRFSPSKPHHGSAKHIGSFSPGLDHIHVKDGSPS